MQASSVDGQILAVRISLAAVMTALVAVTTFVTRVPNAMGGYFNFGDVAIFAVALALGPVIGGFAGGVGSALSDAIGFPAFVIPTLVIKGIEGLLAGLISNRKSLYRDILAVFVGGGFMIVGYFLVELFLPGWGLGPALTELPGNVLQIVGGGLIGIPVAQLVRRRLPPILRQE